MRDVLLIGTALWAIGGGGAARAAGPGGGADEAAIRAAIGAQIAAFGRDDGDSAFSYAAPNIRARFGDGATFLGAVRAGYPQVYRPRSFTFVGLAADAQGHQTETVDLVGADGGHTIALYSMEHEADGRWLIAGCELQRPEQTTA